MKRLLLVIAGPVASAAEVMAQDAPQQQAPRMRPALNLMGEKQVDPRVGECSPKEDTRTKKDE